jgi:hypothetical protein
MQESNQYQLSCGQLWQHNEKFYAVIKEITKSKNKGNIMIFKKSHI